VHTFVGLDTLALDCVVSSQLLGELRPGFEDGTLKPYPVLSTDTYSLADALVGYKKVLAGATDRVVLHP
jgi:NADPH:quinone reductase